jgi:hypothetical protein
MCMELTFTVICPWPCPCPCPCPWPCLGAWSCPCALCSTGIISSGILWSILFGIARNFSHKIRWVKTNSEKCPTSAEFQKPTSVNSLHIMISGCVMQKHGTIEIISTVLCSSLVIAIQIFYQCNSRNFPRISCPRKSLCIKFFNFAKLGYCLHC